MNKYKLTPAYKAIFDELSKEKYKTYNVHDFYIKRDCVGENDKINVVIRIDVDNGLHLSVPLSEELHKRSLNASHYFLTDSENYYNVWGSGVPLKVASLQQEVGLHYDHLYEQLSKGIDGIKKFKEDIKKLEKESQTKIHGACFHGHQGIDSLGRSNWELISHIPPEELGLTYHDGITSHYIKPASPVWAPYCDIRITDYLGYSNSWGWNYAPKIPLKMLQIAKPGQVVHLAFHTQNAFEYWNDWVFDYEEKQIQRDSTYLFYKKKIGIKFRKFKKLKNLHYWKDASINRSIIIISYFLARIVVRVVSNFYNEEQNPDVSWATGRDKIFENGLDPWKQIIQKLDLQTNGTVVEIGSGNGQWLLSFCEKAERVIGFEPWPPIRAYSKEMINKYSNILYPLPMKVPYSNKHQQLR